MATGIPPKDKAKHKKIPIQVMYEGKEDARAIISKTFNKYDEQIKINEGGTNQFFWGDNLDVLLYMLGNGYRGKIKLVYIDPPFATTSTFVNRNQEHAYTDILSGGEFVEFLRQRLILIHELLAEDGSIYLHLDNKMAFTMKLIMDEIFGEANCRAFITRKKCSTKNYTKNTYGNISDYIMFYSKTEQYVWNRPFAPWDYDKMIEQYPYIDKRGRRYKKVPIHAPGERKGETGKAWRGKLPPKGKHWQYTPAKLDELDAAGEIYWSPTGNPRRMVFCDPSKGIPVQDIWMDYRDSVNQSQKTTGYPTEKNFDMLKMIVEASSNVGDVVMDCFAGSGTTLGAAFDLGRQWIGVDNSLESLRAILKRFVSGLEMYGDYVNASECLQCSFDIVEKCKFTIYSPIKYASDVKEVYSDFLQKEAQK